jgi:hypothetical protein
LGCAVIAARHWKWSFGCASLATRYLDARLVVRWGKGGFCAEEQLFACIR